MRSLYLYLEGETFVHRLHPTLKLWGMLVLFVAAFVSDRLPLLLPVTAAVMLLLAASRSLSNVGRLRVLFVAVFTMTFLIWTFFYGSGDALLALGPFAVSSTGLRFALMMAVKLATLLAVGTLFLSVAKVEEFAYALTRAGIPYKFGFTITLAFRLVPVFVDAAFAVVQAQRCRGYDFAEGSFWQRVRRYVPVIVPVFIGALRRADHMAMALEARGFQRRNRRTFYQRYELGSRDVLAAIALIAIGAAYGWLWYTGRAAAI